MRLFSDRRRFLGLGLGATGAWLLASSRAFADRCGIIPKQTAGPFYPGESAFHKDFDLTKLPGQKERAKGQVVYVSGKVVGTDCKPVAGVSVEIWQACATGKYNHAGDPNPAAVDPHFRYCSEAITDKNGEYTFKTIVPGAYPADADWMRPPHIHFKVAKLGYKELITQMYFKGNHLNDKDLILLAVPESQRASCVVDFTESGKDLEPGSKQGKFQITLEAVRG